LRITSRVVDPADGFQIWSERIETEPDLQDLSTVSERIASSLVSRIRPTNGFNKQQHSLHHVQLILNSRDESGLLTHVCDRIQQSEYQVEGPIHTGAFVREEPSRRFLDDGQTRKVRANVSKPDEIDL